MGVKIKIFVSGIFLVSAGMVGAQQAPATRQPVAGQNSQTTATQQARAEVSGTVISASSGQPVRKASVTLLPSNTNNGQQGNRGGFGGGGQFNPPGQPQGGQAAGQAPQNGQNGRGGQQGQQGRGQGGGGGALRTVTTGDDGGFQFTEVNPGTYRVRVDRDGFLTQEYGQRSWTGSGVPITVQAGQRLNSVSFQLVQGGTIVGRILDENLEPVTGIDVQALGYVYQNGTRTLVSERRVETNDLGEYRLYWLTPGDHYVSAIPSARRGGIVQAAPSGFQRGGRGGGGQIPALPGSDNGPEETYASTFYPGTIDPETAAPVRVGAASEVRGVDFVLRPTPTVKVSGRVIGVEVAPTAQQLQQQAQQQAQQGRGGRGNRGNNNGGRGGRGPFGGGNMQVLLTRTGASATGGGGGRGGPGGGGRGGRGGGGLGGVQFIAPVNTDGTFEIADVIPGSYNLVAVQQAQDQIYSALLRLDVGPGGVAGINLGVRPGVDIPGQIYLDGTPAANFQLNRIRISLSSQDNLPLGNTNAEVDENGRFILRNVPAMSYRVNVQGLPTGAYLMAGRFGNVDALGDPLQVDQTGNLALQIGFSPGQVTANVADNVGQAFPGAITVLIPSARKRTDLYKTATSDTSGNVTFTGIAPGDYKILAWEDVPQGAYLNPDFVAPYEDRAQSIHVERTSTTGAQVKVITRDEQ